MQSDELSGEDDFVDDELRESMDVEGEDNSDDELTNCDYNLPIDQSQINHDSAEVDDLIDEHLLDVCIRCFQKDDLKVHFLYDNNEYFNQYGLSIFEEKLIKEINQQKEQINQVHNEDSVIDEIRKEEPEQLKVIEKQKKKFDFKYIKTVPESWNRFKKVVYDLNPKVLDDPNLPKDFSPFKFAKFSCKTEYHDIDTYIKTFIPLVYDKIWYEIKSFKSGQYVDIVSKGSQVNYEIATLKCFSLREKSKPSPFKFGQIVKLRFQKEDTESYFSYFGIVLGIEPNEINERSIKIFDDSLPDGYDEQKYIIDKIDVEMLAVNDNNSILKQCKIVSKSVQSLILQAKSIYQFKESTKQIYKEILKPNFIESKGLDANIVLEERNKNREKQYKFLPEEFDAIQKAYQMFYDPTLHITCIDGPSKSFKTEILREVCLQLLKFGSKGYHNDYKLLIISNKDQEIRSLVSYLKRKKIPVYDIIDYQLDKCYSFSKDEFQLKYKTIISDLIKNCNKEEKLCQAYNNILDYHEGKVKYEDLSSLAIYQEHLIMVRAKYDFINEARVIIGNINSICNDVMFNFYIGQKKPKETFYALIDDAHLLSEPEIIQLLCYNMEKMVLFGNCCLGTNNRIIKVIGNHRFNIRDVDLDQIQTFYHRYAKLNKLHFGLIEKSENSMVWFTFSHDELRRKKYEQSNVNNRRNCNNRSERNRRSGSRDRFSCGRGSYDRRPNHPYLSRSFNRSPQRHNYAHRRPSRFGHSSHIERERLEYERNDQFESQSNTSFAEDIKPNFGFNQFDNPDLRYEITASNYPSPQLMVDSQYYPYQQPHQYPPYHPQHSQYPQHYHG